MQQQSIHREPTTRLQYYVLCEATRDVESIFYIFGALLNTHTYEAEYFGGIIRSIV